MNIKKDFRKSNKTTKANQNEDFLPLCRDDGSRILIIYHSPFDEVYVDEAGLRETSAQCILITSAALKEFP